MSKVVLIARRVPILPLLIWRLGGHAVAGKRTATNGFAMHERTSRPIITVTGEVPSSDWVPTLSHEHLWCDISTHSGNEDNVIQDVELVADELTRFRAAGGGAIVEMTCEGIGRNPGALRSISMASGILIVSGIAFYDESTYPEWVRQATVDRIADFFVREIEEGSRGVRAGVIGELMSHNAPEPDPLSYTLHVSEARVFRAAAKAQRRTGVAISTHASLGRAGHAQLDELERGGADPAKVAIGHCDAYWHPDPERDMRYYVPILARGACCGFDMIGWDGFMPDRIRAERIAALVRAGYERRILLSTDTCRKSHLHANGGRGFDYLWKAFLPLLRAEGVAESQIDSMLIEAPRCLLAREGA